MHSQVVAGPTRYSSTVADKRALDETETEPFFVEEDEDANVESEESKNAEDGALRLAGAQELPLRPPPLKDADSELLAVDIDVDPEALVDASSSAVEPQNAPLPPSALLPPISGAVGDALTEKNSPLAPAPRQAMDGSPHIITPLQPSVEGEAQGAKPITAPALPAAAAPLTLDMPHETPLFALQNEQVERANSAAPTPAHHHKSALNGTVPEQITQSIIKVFKQGQTTTTELRLNPYELGNVKLELTMRNESLHVTLFVERPESLDLIRKHIETLSAELKQAGFSKTTLDFGAWSQQGNAHEKPHELYQKQSAHYAQIAVELSEPDQQRPMHAGESRLHLRL